MDNVSIRDLRNHGGDIVDRAANGEWLTITKSGKPVAELRPLSPRPLPIDVILARRRHLPKVDPEQLRRDLDSVIDPSI